MSSSFFGTGDVASWWLDKDDDDPDNDDPFKAEENEKDCTVFVVDCNENMFLKMKSELQNDSNPDAMDVDKNLSKFASVCKAIEHTLKRKIIKSKDDLVCFILFNTLETKNAMKLSNIYLLSEPDAPSAKSIKQIRDLPITYSTQFKSLKDNKQCDFRDLLWTLQNIFSEIDVKGTKYGSKRAFIFTDNDLPYHKDLNATKAKAADMLDSGMEISVFPLADNFKIKKFYGNICTFNLDELSAESQFRENCPKLSDLENDLRVKEMKKRSVASCPLTIGPNFKMAVKMYSLYRRATKESPQWLDARSNQPLTTETRWICADTGQILDESQIKTYHEYGPKRDRVYFTKQEMKELKTFGSPSLTLMGFKPMHRLKPYYQYKPSQFIYPDEQRCIGSTLAFNALLQAMIEEKQFAVCRYIYRKVSCPRFVALVAQKEIIDKDTNQQIQAPGMNMIFLPFADDIRKIDVEGLGDQQRCDTSNSEHAVLIEKAKKVVDKLTITDLHQPTNPVLQKHYDALEALALEQLEDDNKIDDDEEGGDGMAEDVFVDEIKPPNEDMLAAAKDDIDEFLEILSNFGEMVSSDTGSRSRKRAAADGNDGGGRKRKVAKRKATDNPSSSGSDFDWKKLAENDELKSLKVKDLKVYLSENGLKMSGKKAVLIERIKDHLGI